MTTLLPVTRAVDLDPGVPDRRWLVDELWADEAVGIVGGEPKCCKSFLALDIAVAVAGGVPCLRRFALAQTGRVLLFAAEDALHVVRRRLAGIAEAGGTKLADLDIHVITAPSVRLDVERDRDSLAETIATLRPKLLVLDPLVRLHRIDENASGEVAPLLAYLRELQRRYHLAVLLVHHARKGGGKMRGGQALRGSSEFHAWGDSNLYLRRHGDQLTLTVEHRAAPSIAVPLQLEIAGDAVALAAVDHGAPITAVAPASPLTTEQKIEQHLSAAPPPPPPEYALPAEDPRPSLPRSRTHGGSIIPRLLVSADRVKDRPHSARRGRRYGSRPGIARRGLSCHRRGSAGGGTAAAIERAVAS